MRYTSRDFMCDSETRCPTVGMRFFVSRYLFLLRSMYSIVLYCVRVGADDVFGLERRRKKVLRVGWIGKQED